MNTSPKRAVKGTTGKRSTTARKPGGQDSFYPSESEGASPAASTSYQGSHSSIAPQPILPPVVARGFQDGYQHDSWMAMYIPPDVFWPSSSVSSFPSPQIPVPTTQAIQTPDFVLQTHSLDGLESYAVFEQSANQVPLIDWLELWNSVSPVVANDAQEAFDFAMMPYTLGFFFGAHFAPPDE